MKVIMYQVVILANGTVFGLVTVKLEGYRVECLLGQKLFLCA